MVITEQYISNVVKDVINESFTSFTKNMFHKLPDDTQTKIRDFTGYKQGLDLSANNESHWKAYDAFRDWLNVVSRKGNLDMEQLMSYIKWNGVPKSLYKNVLDVLETPEDKKHIKLILNGLIDEFYLAANEGTVNSIN